MTMFSPLMDGMNPTPACSALAPISGMLSSISGVSLSRRLDADHLLKRRKIQHTVERNPAGRDIQVADRMVYVARRLEAASPQRIKIARENDRRAEWIDRRTTARARGTRGSDARRAC